MPEQEGKPRLLIVSESSAMHVEALNWSRTLGFDSVIFAVHENALAVAAAGSFTHIIVSDYSEDPGRTQFRKGYETWRRLKERFAGNTAGNMRLIRCGFDEYAHEDYVRLPFRIWQLAAAFGININAR
ncbi:MAG: hypothetical protein U1A16_01730 [Patescibacteria group bacterium]|nr:hypothetical protein [Patescibacteria group bacterium]